MEVSGVYKPTYHWAHYLIIRSYSFGLWTSQLSNLFPCYHHDPRWPTWHFSASVSFNELGLHAKVHTRSLRQRKSIKPPSMEKWMGLSGNGVWPVWTPKKTGNFNSKRIMNHRLLGWLSLPLSHRSKVKGGKKWLFGVPNFQTNPTEIVDRQHFSEPWKK